MSNKTIRTHFTDREMDCGCGCQKTVAPELLVRLEALRALIEKSLTITSGARCEKHNRAIGGATHSWHLNGLAVDIACTDSKLRIDILRNAGKLGFNGIGIAKTFIHLELRPVENGCCFLYN